MDIIQSRKVPKVVTKDVESVIDVDNSLNSLVQPEIIYNRLGRQIISWKGDVVYVFE